MIRAVIFDMYETLITHYRSPLYFGAEIAAEAGVAAADFLPRWRALEVPRSTGGLTLEATMERLLRELGAYSEDVVQRVCERRREVKRDCFRHLHPDLLPMLNALQEKEMRIGLISNCYEEEAAVIRESVLFPYFDAPMLSWEQGVSKPDPVIFQRCMAAMGVQAAECLYIGDGGSRELETARSLGMTAMQALWYLSDDPLQGLSPKPGFTQLWRPTEVLDYLAD